MIRHTVVFKLKCPIGSSEEQAFLKEAMKLSFIPGVHHFECLRQTSKKNSFEYGISMEFDTNKAYEEYNHHPDHVAFVKTFWMRDVNNFLEIDYEPIN
jgi:heme-degrading monooxygenase HmoA